ncbi:1,4-dihydroxy-6-naphthoate synthase [Paenibacillus guangzhouensis]|uniref:1,4-dihydroxy-6-naphthoate synthase n=1 Tax=Paenibacillus guangzhouensis TaxID=1473112 RepID=UPI001D121490|nr:1,4-dihydroxy-6-naphthoate synthase [Paenibacillus guangzhouensis]
MMELFNNQIYKRGFANTMIENDTFCKIFIDTDEQYEYLYHLINKLVNGNAETRRDIKNETLVLSLVKNDDFDAIQRLDFPDGFLHSRYYLEVEPNGNFEFQRYIMSISLLLESLWTSGLNAVAACDFEELLPRKGGYNYVGD